jgi:cobalamin biosynthetic protein CobC
MTTMAAAPSSLRASRTVVAHGGDLHRAIARYDRPRADWLDLSTGVNPQTYPVSMPPAEIWRTLPDDHDDLATIAAAYYGCPVGHVLPVAGSQAVIRMLPTILRDSMARRAEQDGITMSSSLGDAAVATLTYGEYAPAFTAAGVRVHCFDPADPAPLDTLPETVRYLVVVNPNNPTTDRHTPERLRAWQAILKRRGGALIVDEAFVDAYDAAPASFASPEASAQADSLAQWDAADTSRIVFRSVGKFFGLAGIRSGFVLAAPALCETLRAHLGAWTVSGPARHATREALSDTAWQHTMRLTLGTQSRALHALLLRHGFPARITPLFAWWPWADAFGLQDQLAEQGIWIRCFAAPDAPVPSHLACGGFVPTPRLPSIRIGLPGSDAALARLDRALHATRKPEAARDNENEGDE